MTPDEERYVHFAHCIEDLNDAWRVLKELQGRAAYGVVEAAAFRYALVAYARPYTSAKGDAVKNHCLGSEHIPAKHRDQHTRLLDARHKIHGHSDLTVRDACVYVREVQGKKIVLQVRSGIEPLEELRHIDQIVDLIEGTLDRMYAKAERVECQFNYRSTDDEPFADSTSPNQRLHRTGRYEVRR